MNKTRMQTRQSSWLKESRNSKLQRDVESITQSLEHEKREAGYLEEQIRLIQIELNALPKSKKGNSSLKAEVAVTEKKLELEKNHLNTARYKNKQYREKINEFRLDKLAHKQSLNAIIESLDETSKKAEETFEELEKTKEDYLLQNEKIGVIRSKSVNQRSKYHEKISSLGSLLKTKMNVSSFNFEDKNYYSNSIEVTSVLKKLVKQWEADTIDKKRNIDYYLRHISTLVDGFEQIKKIMGISGVDEIVTSCIKGEEQGQAILMYLNGLNSEIDGLDETLRSNKLKIEMLEGSKQTGQVNVQEYLRKKEENQNELHLKIIEKEEKLNEINQTIAALLPMVKQLYALLASINFSPYLNSRIEMSSVEKLNLETSNILLGQIEEFINYLLIAIALKSQSSLKIPSEPLSHHLPFNPRSHLKEMFEEKDLFDEPELDEIKVPISIADMKVKAMNIFEKRRNMIRSKGNTPDANAKTPKNGKPSIDFV